MILEVLSRNSKDKLQKKPLTADLNNPSNKIKFKNGKIEKQK